MDDSNIFMDLDFAPERCSAVEQKESAYQMLHMYSPALLANWKPKKPVNPRDRKMKNADTALQLPPTADKELKDLIEVIYDGYADLSYHNFAHALDVTQLMFTFLSNSQFDLDFDDRERFYLLFACLCHDIGHFGVGNKDLYDHFGTCSFTCQHTRKLNQDTNPTIMEQFHAEETVKILETHAFFSHEDFAPNIKSHLKVWACNLILSTDLGNQKYFLDSIATDSEFNTFSEDAELKNYKAPGKLALLLIKLSDMGNVFRRYASAKRWTELVMIEIEAAGAVVKGFEGKTPTMKDLLKEVQETSTELLKSRKFEDDKVHKRMSEFIARFVHPMLLHLRDLNKDVFLFLCEGIIESFRPAKIDSRKYEDLIKETKRSGVFDLES